jgi:hypothetical protein
VSSKEGLAKRLAKLVEHIEREHQDKGGERESEASHAQHGRGTRYNGHHLERSRESERNSRDVEG